MNNLQILLIGSIKALQMLVRILMLEEYKVPVSRGELDKFVLNVVEDLQNHSKIQHYPGTILKTINGWGNVDGKVYGVMQKVGTALHWAVELKDAKMFADILEVKIVDVNAVNWMGCTALHMAVLNGSIDIVRVLLTCKDRMRLTEQDKGGQTLVQIAHNRGHIDIERALMKCEAVRQYIQELYRDHQVYVDAANAILVGAALIASVTFASWLQPPLSYSLQGYVDVEQSFFLLCHWNSCVWCTKCVAKAKYFHQANCGETSHQSFGDIHSFGLLCILCDNSIWNSRKHCVATNTQVPMEHDSSYNNWRSSVCN
jgi:hypothetical protein